MTDELGHSRAGAVTPADPRTAGRAAREGRPGGRARWGRRRRGARGAPPRLAPTSWKLVVWLTVVWVLLWGDLSVGNVVAGLALGLFVTILMPMPRATGRTTVRPLAVVVLVAVFVREVLRASWQIVVLTVRGRPPRGAVIRVQLRSHSDLILTGTGGMCSLVPGSLVVEAMRLSGMLYMHILDVDIAGGLERAHSDVLDQEERLLRAFATDDQLVDAGFRPGWSRRAGRLPSPSVEGPAAEAPSEDGQSAAGQVGPSPTTGGGA
ncbi:Na+/H+ antiporter subunit E [Georgenia sp. Z1491]|uniref:Na+/H+ antiporter subunit E n=1 Tax=Georgenia sp. Z1491 TaxID=3416707 RepID=UPI003CE76476